MAKTPYSSPQQSSIQLRFPESGSAENMPDSVVMGEPNAHVVPYIAVPSVYRPETPDADPPSLIRLVAAQGSSVPVVASRAPRPCAGDPLMLRNTPPTITRLPSGVRAIVLTLSSAVGAQPSSEPSAALNAARWLRATPLA